jgi:NADPH2:quinone reductase
MQAVIYERFGGPEVLQLAEVDPPQANDTAVLIDVHYASVNPIDWKLREGLYASLLRFQFPVVPGWDVAGTVAAVGKSVTQFAPGERVYAMAVSDPIGIGTYGEQTLAREAVLAHIPETLSLREAAAVPLVATSAHDALFRLGGVRAGQRVLIQQGAGGVGNLAIQLAKAAGAFVYATCSTPNMDYVAAFGADRVIDYTHEDFTAVVTAAEPEGLDFVLDGVGGDTLRRSYSVVKAGGVLITMGDPPDTGLAAARGARTKFLDATPNGELLTRIAGDIDQGRIKLPEILELPLSEAAEAQRHSQAGHVRGKIVLKVR